MLKISISIILLLLGSIHCTVLSSEPAPDSKSSSKNLIDSHVIPKNLSPFFQPPAELAGDFGNYRSPLTFYDGRQVESLDDWNLRRQEILDTWHEFMGAWPTLLPQPQIEYLDEEIIENISRQKVKVEIAPGGRTIDGFLMIPIEKIQEQQTLPAVIVVYYDPETGAGLGKELRDFGYQLAIRGFAALSIGMPASLYYPSKANAELQPLSALAYAAANSYNALAAHKAIDPQRIGIMGHSYGGKWAMFASCLYEKFACAAWSDGGIVFDETRPNVNYWEPWYLGYDQEVEREKGVPTQDNPRTGAYKRLLDEGHDLHELHALMAPRPFLVSGGSEDQPERWRALNQAIAVNHFLGFDNRVAMTNRDGHSPTQESNEQIYLFFEHFLKKDEK